VSYRDIADNILASFRLRQQPRRKQLIALAALWLASTAVTFSPPAIADTQQEPVSLTVAGPANEGFKDVYYAAQAGIFKKYGLIVTPRLVNGGAVALAGLVGGSYDVAYTNLVPVLQAHGRGVPFQIVSPSTMFMTERMQNAMLVVKDSPLRSARDLNGKTIGVQSLQDLNSVAMRAWIDKNGGHSSSVHVLEVPSAAAVASLTSHRIDAMALSEPLLSMALSTGSVRVFAQPQSAIASRFQAQGFVAMADFVSQHQDVMARFARAMHESAVYNNAHLADTVELVSSFTKVPADVINHSVRAIDGEYIDVRHVQPLIDAAAKYGMIPHAFPAEEIISSAALKPH
jgi:NitT/TauT family transport system substrate-binding protein